MQASPILGCAVRAVKVRPPQGDRYWSGPPLLGSTQLRQLFVTSPVGVFLFAGSVTASPFGKTAELSEPIEKSVSGSRW